MTWWPTTKKVARTPWRAKTSSTAGVHSGSGPSSKVRTTVFGGVATDCTSSPRRSNTGPAVMKGSPAGAPSDGLAVPVPVSPEV